MNKSNAFPISFQYNKLSTLITASDMNQWNVLNSMGEEPSEIVIVQITRTEYIMQFYDDLVVQIPWKRI